MIARLYSNQNFRRPVVEKLRSLGPGVLTTQEAGQADQAMSVKQVLAFATSEKRVVSTLSRLYFIQLHREKNKATS